MQANHKEDLTADRHVQTVWDSEHAYETNVSFTVDRRHLACCLTVQVREGEPQRIPDTGILCIKPNADPLVTVIQIATQN